MIQQAVTGEEFRAQLRPGADALQRLVEFGRSYRQGISLPQANAVAMHELNEESRFAGDWNDEPARHAHVLAGFLAFAAEDELLTLAHSLKAEYTPLFAPTTLLRGALEACGRAVWLLEVPITVEQRISRRHLDRDPEPRRSARLRRSHRQRPRRHT